MLKGLSRLWWRGVKRIGKAQQAKNKKIVKSLLAPPAKPRKPKSATVKKPASAVTRSNSKPEQTFSAQLPGKWLSSYYTAFPDELGRPARRMNYWLYLPHNAIGPTVPMVVMLHGCEQTAPQFSQGTRMNRLAEEKGFAVLYPQQSLRGHPNRCWKWYDRVTQDGGGDIELITGIIDTVIAKYPIDTGRIYAAGISAGAAMAHILALTHPYRIAAVGLHSGPVFGAGHSRMGAYSVMQSGSLKAAGSAVEEVMHRSAAFPKMPAILIQGQADRIVRPVNQVQLAQQFKALNRLGPENAAPQVIKAGGRAGSKNAAHSYKLQDYVASRKLMLRVCEIAQLEHAWSGGDCTLQYNACARPDASKMMWDFFARHRRTPL